MLKKHLLTLLLISLACPLVVNAENRAVTDLNYSANAHLSKRDEVTSFGGGVDINIPVAKYLGINIGADATRVNSVLDSDTYAITGGVFLRDYDFGLIGFNVRHHEFRSSNLPNANLQSYTINGELYFDKITVGMNGSHAESNDSNVLISNDDNAAALLSFYPLENLAIRAFAGFLDFKENYGLSTTYQAPFLGSKLSVDVGLSFDEDDETNVTTSLTYYFGKRNTLINRDRKERF